MGRVFNVASSEGFLLIKMVQIGKAKNKSQPKSSLLPQTYVALNVSDVVLRLTSLRNTS